MCPEKTGSADRDAILIYLVHWMESIVLHHLWFSL